MISIKLFKSSINTLKNKLSLESDILHSNNYILYNNTIVNISTLEEIKVKVENIKHFHALKNYFIISSNINDKYNIYIVNKNNEELLGTINNLVNIYSSETEKTIIFLSTDTLYIYDEYINIVKHINMVDIIDVLLTNNNIVLIKHTNSEYESLILDDNYNISSKINSNTIGYDHKRNLLLTFDKDNNYIMQYEINGFKYGKKINLYSTDNNYKIDNIKIKRIEDFIFLYREYIINNNKYTHLDIYYYKNNKYYNLYSKEIKGIIISDRLVDNSIILYSLYNNTLIEYIVYKEYSYNLIVTKNYNKLYINNLEERIVPLPFYDYKIKFSIGIKDYKVFSKDNKKYIGVLLNDSRLYSVDYSLNDYKFLDDGVHGIDVWDGRLFVIKNDNLKDGMFFSYINIEEYVSLFTVNNILYYIDTLGNLVDYHSRERKDFKVDVKKRVKILVHVDDIYILNGDRLYKNYKYLDSYDDVFINGELLFLERGKVLYVYDQDADITDIFFTLYSKEKVDNLSYKKILDLGNFYSSDKVIGQLVSISDMNVVYFVDGYYEVFKPSYLLVKHLVSRLSVYWKPRVHIEDNNLNSITTKMESITIKGNVCWDSLIRICFNNCNFWNILIVMGIVMNEKSERILKECFVQFYNILTIINNKSLEPSEDFYKSLEQFKNINKENFNICIENEDFISSESTLRDLFNIFFRKLSKENILRVLLEIKKYNFAIEFAIKSNHYPSKHNQERNALIDFEFLSNAINIMRKMITDDIIIKEILLTFNLDVINHTLKILGKDNLLNLNENNKFFEIFNYLGYYTNAIDFLEYKNEDTAIFNYIKKHKIYEYTTNYDIICRNCHRELLIKELNDYSLSDKIEIIKRINNTEQRITIINSPSQFYTYTPQPIECKHPPTNNIFNYNYAQNAPISTAYEIYKRIGDEDKIIECGIEIMDINVLKYINERKDKEILLNKFIDHLLFNKKYYELSIIEKERNNKEESIKYLIINKSFNDILEEYKEIRDEVYNYYLKSINSSSISDLSLLFIKKLEESATESYNTILKITKKIQRYYNFHYNDNTNNYDDVSISDTSFNSSNTSTSFRSKKISKYTNQLEVFNKDNKNLLELLKNINHNIYDEIIKEIENGNKYKYQIENDLLE